ncbi:MAG: hypothetical protein IIV93_04975 [Clostridia bacterium]|nr:hypothetical protein [Clostridia bacterium]
MRKQYDDDDGRTIVDMNVEGMPWYDSQIKKEKRKTERAALQEKIDRGEALTRRESIRYTFYAVLAGLAVVAFIGGGTCLFILILWLLWK